MCTHVQRHAAVVVACGVRSSMDDNLCGNCILITSVIWLPLPTTNNCVPNVLINMIATYTTISFTDFHIVKNHSAVYQNSGHILGHE